MKIMFVCHGNICRSPTAEFVMRDIAKSSNCKQEFTISSSATSCEEIWNGVGNPMYPPAKAELERHGIKCDGKRAVQLQKSDYGKYDLFIGMDSANIRNMHPIFGGDVADPWYSDRFDIAYRDIYDGCIGLLDAILNADG